MKATSAAGCFWHVEDLFGKVKGVTLAEVGYTGGWFENPTYEDVCSDKTGHAEAAEVEYDPLQVSYEELLDTFWNNHNTTTPNRQGPDIGTQHRSSILFHDKEQEAMAKESKEKIKSIWQVW
jgi:peptide-methionine (S)-S-oxide reductase